MDQDSNTNHNTKAMNLRLLLTFTILSMFATGCNTTRTLQINTQPPGAFISTNGKNMGKAPQVLEYQQGHAVSISATKEGYFDEAITLYPQSQDLKNGIVTLALMENPIWHETTTSRATNVWLRVQINEALSQKDTWQRVVDAATSTYDSLEQLDPESGYIRSTIRLKRWELGSQGSFTVRTQLIGSIASQSPLIYKFKIKAEFSEGRANDWRPYERVFSKDAEMIEELTNRLGIK
jgi:hypothetical protein